MLGSAESQVPKLISREIIFLPNSNACDHNPPTLQTDGQTDGLTDGQTTYHGNTALRYASRGKKITLKSEMELHEVHLTLWRLGARTALIGAKDSLL